MCRTIVVRKRTMQRAADATFPLVGALVERAERRVGSRMAAYADVARAIGSTGSWVRKFLGRQPVRLDADTYLNIQALYDAECRRWEAETETQRARFFALGRGPDAMGEGEAERVVMAQSGGSRGCGRTPAVVATMVGEGRR